MVSGGAARATGPGLGWFVRGAAVLVGLAGMVGAIAWSGGLYVLGGEDESSLREAIPSAIAAILAGLLTAEIVLRAFELPGRNFGHHYRLVVASVCVGGAIEGAMLGWVFSLDGTLFPEPHPGIYAGELLRLLGDLALVLAGAGMVGAFMGLVAGSALGFVLGAPLAKLLGFLSDGG